jgi:N-methylhydantoinase A/oxoprolinase/acetone carboxylase beta subunit
VNLCPPLKAKKGRALKGRRRAVFADARKPVTCNVYERHLLAPGESIRGPSIIEEAECTIIVPPGLVSRVDRYGNILMNDRKTGT